MDIFNNSYKSLAKHFYTDKKADHFENLQLIQINSPLIKELFQDSFSVSNDNQLAAILAGQSSIHGQADIALAYSGHQFGHFNPTLGDGRAMLLGEVLDHKDQRFDIHLKGSGRTAYSRSGDGKCAIGPGIREYILSEAMFSLGVPTTRALSLSLTGEKVYREEEFDGVVFTRVAASHIRVGTFEYTAYHRDIDGLKQLADYSIQRHYPKLTNSPTKYLDFLEETLKNQAKMVSKWLSLGFIHGVMNTDNMSISGETIDYGPCAFMDDFEWDKSFSSIDRNKRYCYSNQIPVAQWNFNKFANAILPLIHDNIEIAVELAQERFKNIDDIYQQAYLDEMSKKFGIKDPKKEDLSIIKSFLDYLEVNKLDFTQSFRELTDKPEMFKKANFYSEWRNKDIDFELMKLTNPFVIPRNHKVEEVIQAAQSGDYQPFKKMLKATTNPFTKNEEFEQAPTQEQLVHHTFCGT